MPRRIDAVAAVYARSLYELAEEAGGRDKIVEIAGELEQVCELARADPALREFLGSPIVDRGRRGAALRRIFHGRITDLALRFLLVLNENERLDHLEPIGDAYEQLVHETFGRVEVDVHTAAELPQQQRERLRQRVAEALGKEPVLHMYTEPAMLGGVKLRIGDQLIDGSVASRLRRMRRNLLTAGSSALRARIDSVIEGIAQPEPDDGKERS